MHFEITSTSLRKALGPPWLRAGDDTAAVRHRSRYSWAEIDKLPAGARETNQTEINYRDGVAEKLTFAQIAAAQKLARDWLAQNPLSR
jgi:hypothetical protein